MRACQVATSFVRCGGRILLVRRSNAVRTMQGLWGGISGTIEGGEEPLHRARTEVLEEAGIGAGMRLAGSAGPARVCSPDYPGICWDVFSFLFDSPDNTVRLNWENDDFRWAEPQDLAKYDTVPGLGRILAGLLGSG